MLQEIEGLRECVQVAGAGGVDVVGGECELCAARSHIKTVATYARTWVIRQIAHVLANVATKRLARRIFQRGGDSAGQRRRDLIGSRRAGDDQTDVVNRQRVLFQQSFGSRDGQREDSLTLSGIDPRPRLDAGLLDDVVGCVRCGELGED